MFLIFLLKTLIVGTCQIHLGEAVLLSTHNPCFGPIIRNIGIPQHTPFYYIKVGFKGVFNARTSFPDVLSNKKQMPQTHHTTIQSASIRSEIV